MALRDDLAAVLPRLREDDILKFCLFYEKYGPHVPAIDSGLYERLEAGDRARFLVWFLKRWGKIDLVNGVERGLYQATIARVKAEDRPDVEVAGARYRLRDFRSQGWDFQLAGYDWFLGVHDVQYMQYEQGDVQLQPDDVIIDAGAFIGDTAVYFHHKLAGRCQIHSFELLDENLALLQHNLERNGVPDERVVLNKLALTDRTGDEIVIASGSSQGSTSIFGPRDAGPQGAPVDPGHRVQTITLDDYVVCMGLSKVDFIKMDIEGAEVQALKGALQTLAHFRPRLAICLYHKWDDVLTIPRMIEAAGVDYRFSFKWVQLSDGWEAVLLATPAPVGDAGRVRSAGRSTPGSAGAPADMTSDPLAVLARAYLKKWHQADTLWREKRQAQSAATHPSGELTA